MSASMFICIYSLSFYAEKIVKRRKKSNYKQRFYLLWHALQKKNQFKPLIKREWKVFKFKRMGYKQKVYNFQVFLIMLDCNLVKKLFYVIQCFCNKSLWLDPSSVFHQVSGFKVKIFGFSSLNILWCWKIFVSNKKPSYMGRYLSTLCLTVTHLFMPTNLPSLS